MSEEASSELSKEQLEQQCRKAAAVISKADVLVLMTGAGFSADSGLATYTDIAQVRAYQDLELEYADICQMKYMREDLPLFWGFWGSCFNDYRSTQPHEGYSILQRWKRTYFEKSKVSNKIRRYLRKNTTDETANNKLSPYVVENFAGAFFVYTSNVDAHSYDYFDPSEVYECHGNTEIYQCSGIDAITLSRGRLCSKQIWRCPLDHSFAVNLETMKAPSNKENMPSGEKNEVLAETEGVPAVGRTKGSERKNPLLFLPPVPDSVRAGFMENYPRCINCEKLARPAILMFDDSTWLEDPVKFERWRSWKSALGQVAVQRGKLKVAVLEIGAGQRVPTVRYNAARLLDDFDADLIRVNPDWPSSDNQRGISRTISIPARGLESIKCIDKFLTRKS